MMIRQTTVRIPLSGLMILVGLVAALWGPACTHCHAQGDNATAEWLVFRGNPQHTAVSTLAGPPEDIEMKWRWRANNDASPISASPAVWSDGTVCVGTEGGYIAAIQPEGGPGWMYKVDGAVKASPAVDAAGNVFAVTSDGYMYYLNGRGELQWKSDFDRDVASSPVLNGSSAYMGSESNALLAVTLAPEMQDNIHESRRVLPSEVELFTFPTSRKVRSSPAFAGNTVFFGSGSSVYAINPAAGDNASSTSTDLLKWSYDTLGEVLSSPAVQGGVVYVGDESGYLYALKENVSNDLQRGELVWKRKLGDGISSSPAVKEQDGEILVCVGTDSGRLYAVDANGELQWSFVTLGRVRSSPAIDANGDIYVGSDDGYVYALFPDGSLKWKFKTAGPVRSSPAIGPGGRLYVGSDDGYLYCIGASTRETSEPDIKISLAFQSGSSEVEVDGNPTTLFAKISSESEGADILGRIASVTVDLSSLNLIGLKSDQVSFGLINQERMIDGGTGQDDRPNDGVFTYAFQLVSNLESIGLSSGFYNHYIPESSRGVGPVPAMITVTDLFGNRVSKPFIISIVHKATLSPPTSFTVTNRLQGQDLNISFSSFIADQEKILLSIRPAEGTPGDIVNVVIVGLNTSFLQNRTRVEIFNNAGEVIAFAEAGKDVRVLDQTDLVADLTIKTEDEVDNGTIIGEWDVIVTTEVPGESPEIARGVNLFTIKRSMAARSDAMHASAYLSRDPLQDTCELSLDITLDSSGGSSVPIRADGSPWSLAFGYPRNIALENMRSGQWNYDVAVNDGCLTDEYADSLEVKIITKGGGFGYVTGEVRNAFTGQGVDNATITALTGEGTLTQGNTTTSAGGGYYLLPLAASSQPYTVIASKTGMVDIERDVLIEDGQSVSHNFSLVLDLRCPLSQLIQDSRLERFRSLRRYLLQFAPRGRQWIALYYMYGAEVSRLLHDHDRMRQQSFVLVLRILRELPRLLASGRVRAGLSGQVDDVMSIMMDHAGPSLQAALGAEREHVLAFIRSREQP